MDTSIYRAMETLLNYRDAVGEIPLPKHGDVDKMDPFGMSAEMSAYQDLVNARWRESTKRNSAPHVARVIIRIMRGDLADYLTTNFRHRICTTTASFSPNLQTDGKEVTRNALEEP